MKIIRALLVVLTLLSPLAVRAHDECDCASSQQEDSNAKTSSDRNTPVEAPKRYPLKGVIIAVKEADSVIVVKHEEIPGFMKAMTMHLQVDAANLKVGKKGDAITGVLVHEGDEWRLEKVTVVN